MKLRRERWSRSRIASGRTLVSKRRRPTVRPMLSRAPSSSSSQRRRTPASICRRRRSERLRPRRSEEGRVAGSTPARPIAQRTCVPAWSLRRRLPCTMSVICTKRRSTRCRRARSGPVSAGEPSARPPMTRRAACVCPVRSILTPAEKSISRRQRFLLAPQTARRRSRSPRRGFRTGPGHGRRGLTMSRSSPAQHPPSAFGSHRANPYIAAFSDRASASAWHAKARSHRSRSATRPHWNAYSTRRARF